MNKIILVTGGAKSGKSYFSELTAELINKKRGNGKIAYIATGEPFDDEMKERIKRHKLQRKDFFVTYEESINIDRTIEGIFDQYDIFMFECIATWLGNIYHKNRDNAKQDSFTIISSMIKIFKNINNLEVNKDILSILKTAENKKFKINLKDLINPSAKDKVLIIVTNEVNSGLVPDSSLAREYIDQIGRINQQIAENSDFVYYIISGQALRLK